MTSIARCSCGGLTAICPDTPLKTSLCHCSACQRRTGAPFGIAAFFVDNEVEITGPVTTWTRASESGHDVRFGFCPSCGATVFWHPARLPGRISVAVGAFADPDFPAPDQEVHTEDRHRWVAPLPG